MRSGASIEALAQRVNAPVQNAFAVRRTGGDGVTGDAAVATFAGPEGHVALVPSGEGYTLLRVDAVTTDAVAEAVDPISAGEDVLQQFVNDLERRYRPTYNSALAERVRAL